MTIQEQVDELDCMLSMFPNPDELEYDHSVKEAYDAYLSNPYADDTLLPSTRLHYTLKFKDLRFGREVPALEITYPADYPAASNVEFTVRCPFLSRETMEHLHTTLLCIATGANGEVVVLQLYQKMLDILIDVQDLDQKHQDADSASLYQSMGDMQLNELKLQESALSPPVLGRRAIYFHHIIASNKRRVVMEWALELQLGGFSKIGWPGIVIVEGAEACVKEYVRRLQHLRWKQMVVRGEQIEQDTQRTVDAMRKLPQGFQEFPENGMTALAAACRQFGVEELFLTTMKIYNRQQTEESENENFQKTAAPAGKRKEKKKHEK